MPKITQKDIEMIGYLYLEKRMSMKKVAQTIGCSDRTVCDYLQKYFTTRNRSEALKGREVTEKMRESARNLGKSRVGSKNPNWKGRVNRAGYIGVRCPDHPNASKDGYVMEHRLVMENKLGRYLTQDEDVHHINGIKTDNEPGNLLVINKSDHARMHGLEKVQNLTHNMYIHLTTREVMEAVMKGGTVKEITARLSIEKSTFYKKIKRMNLDDWYKNWREQNEQH